MQIEKKTKIIIEMVTFTKDVAKVKCINGEEESRMGDTT
jgi:hypothetical protein